MTYRHNIEGSLTLAQYCDVLGRGGRAKVARLAGATWKTIDSICKDGRCARPDLAIAIEMATDRQVRAEVILGLPALRLKAERMMKKAGVIGDYRLIHGTQDGRASLR